MTLETANLAMTNVTRTITSTIETGATKKSASTRSRPNPPPHHNAEEEEGLRTPASARQKRRVGEDEGAGLRTPASPIPHDFGDRGIYDRNDKRDNDKRRWRSRSRRWRRA